MSTTTTDVCDGRQVTRYGASNIHVEPFCTNHPSDARPESAFRFALAFNASFESTPAPLSDEDLLTTAMVVRRS
jgi:hypothetical protein